MCYAPNIYILTFIFTFTEPISKKTVYIQEELGRPGPGPDPIRKKHKLYLGLPIHIKLILIMLDVLFINIISN